MGCMKGGVFYLRGKVETEGSRPNAIVLEWRWMTAEGATVYLFHKVGKVANVARFVYGDGGLGHLGGKDKNMAISKKVLVT